jgi:membrane protein implicated in regulation of membrane protease activity
MTANDIVVITAIVLARLALPLLIPSVHLTALDIALGVVALVAANLAIATWAGRGLHFALLLAINFSLIYAGSRALSERGTCRSPTVCSSRT